jgi:VWFA-related protein
MTILRRALLIVALFLMLAVGIAGQQSNQNPAKQDSGKSDTATPIFRVQSRLVVVDVVVTDRSGASIAGLKPGDFQVFEAGSPQKVRFFEEHTSARVRPPEAPPKLPPHQYTNFPVDPPNDTMNILLFDILNTPITDQTYARQQMLKALETLPPGRQLALFILGGRLQMIQGPSGDSATLIQAAKTLQSAPARLVKNDQQAAGETDLLATMANNAGAGSYGTPSPVEEQLRVALFKENSHAVDERIRSTLSALQALARMVSGYPGRKNLIWISSGIPFQIGPDAKLDKYHMWRDKKEFIPELERAGSLLANAQVSIYPVDVSGMQVLGVNASVSGTSFSAGGRDYRQALQDQSNDEWNNRVAMTDLATQTGGHAFFGTNDLSAAIKGAIEQGAHYYTIAYTPSSQKWDGSYRPIDIKSTRGGLELKYRKGYVATAEKPPSEHDALRLMAAAMQLGMPQSTALLMRVQVLPPDKENKKVKIDYAVAWDDKTKLVDSISNSMETTLKPNTNPESLKTGLPGHLELSLKPGRYLLSVGVMDRTSQKIGTVWLSLTVGDSAKSVSGN